MRSFIFAIHARVFPILAIVVLAVSASGASPKFQVLHAFAGGATDGGSPVSNLLLDKNGNLFGTTGLGGLITDCYTDGCGTAFELSPRNGRWKENVLYDFSPTSNGEFPNPSGTLVFDSKGNVYGTQSNGGDPSCQCGVVYQLTRSGGIWTENVLHTFTGGTSDGFYPYWGLVRDAVGNLYGATENGGSYGYGTIFELTSNADGTWTYNLIYEFGTAGIYDAQNPYGPLMIDSSGNLYGTTVSGGTFGYGSVFKLSPSGGTWTDTVLFNFTLDYGSYPNPVGVVMDASGNLYGTTTQDGTYAVGTIYKLTPSGAGFWNRTILHTFTGSTDGAYPYGGLAIDKSGVLYGTADSGGSFGYGNVYKLAFTNGKWNQTILHAFTKGNDGANPFAGVILDQLGNVYGAAGNGGAYGFGVVFEITP